MTNDQLYHHGILGQRWGERNGPPYPLDYGSHSADEKRQNAKRSINKYDSKSQADHDSKKVYQLPDKQISDRAKKMLIIGGATGVTLVAAYTLVRYTDINSDMIIKAGDPMFRVASSGNASLHNIFYATSDKADAIKYVGWHASLLKDGGAKEVFQKTISSSNDLKIAGTRNAEKIYQNLIRTDAEFAKSFKGVSYRTFNKYDMPSSNFGAKRFISELQRRGYSGLKDLNDIDFGYETRKPVIIFNDTANAQVDNVRKLTQGEISRSKVKATGMLMVQAILSDKSFATTSVGALTVGTISYTKNGEKMINKVLSWLN